MDDKKIYPEDIEATDDEITSVACTVLLFITAPIFIVVLGIFYLL